MALLVACAETHPDRATIREIILHGQGRWDWPQLTREAQLHGVLPLVARNLAEQGCDLIPPDSRQTLKSLYQRNLVRNTLMFRALTDFLARSDAAGVRVVPFKGPTLAIRGYGHLGYRQFSDLDVLVQLSDVPKLAVELETAGFRHMTTEQVGQYANFEAPIGGFYLDVQWGLAPKWFPFPADLPATWARIARVDIDGHSLWQPSNEDMLLLLAGHAAKHCWSKLGWVADLKAFTRANGAEIDWDVLFRRARRVGGHRGLLIGFALVRDLMRGVLPEDVERRIERDAQAVGIAATVRAKLAVGGDKLLAHTGAFGARDRWLFQLKARDRLRDRLRYVRHLISAPIRRPHLLIGKR